MNISWIEQENIITTKLKNVISEKIYKLKDKTMRNQIKNIQRKILILYLKFKILYQI